MKLLPGVKNNKLDNLIIADHIIMGFNCYYLIEVLHEAIVESFDIEEAHDFIDLMNVHYYEGILGTKIRLEEVINSKLKENILADSLLDLYDLYKICVYYLLGQYNIDSQGITNFFKRMYHVPMKHVDYNDYVQAHRWFTSAIDYYAGGCPRSICYERFYKVDPATRFYHVLTMSEVEKLAENICVDFTKMVELREFRSQRVVKENEVSKRKSHRLKAQV